jgi:hypothetical protein
MISTWSQGAGDTLAQDIDRANDIADIPHTPHDVHAYLPPYSSLSGWPRSVRRGPCSAGSLHPCGHGPEPLPATRARGAHTWLGDVGGAGLSIASPGEESVKDCQRHTKIPEIAQRDAANRRQRQTAINGAEREFPGETLAEWNFSQGISAGGGKKNRSGLVARRLRPEDSADAGHRSQGLRG